MRLLVADGDQRAALPLVRALARHHQVVVAAPRRWAPALHSRFAHERLLSPDPADERALFEWLDRVVASERPDQVLACSAATLGVLSAAGDRWARQVALVVPPAAALARVREPRQALELAERLGLPVPLTLKPPQIDALDASGRAVGYPLTIQASRNGLRATAYVERPQELRERYLAYVERYRLLLDELPLLQQRLIGDRHGVWLTYQHGACKRIMAYREQRSGPSRGAQSACVETVYDASLFEMARRLVDALGWHGLIEVEFCRHQLDGQFYFMGVQPTLGSAFALAGAAGADFAGDWVALGREEPLPALEHQGQGLRFCWPLGADLAWGVSHPRAWRRVLRDWLDPSVAKNLRPDDPLPHAFEALGALLHLLA